MKAILIDDEQAALLSLKSKLELYCPEIEILELCDSAKTGFKAVNTMNPDIIFLDIEMPWINGFEFLESLGDDIQFEVIFVTAYNQYAIKAFKYSAMDYLLKPVIKDDLIELYERLLKKKSKFDKDKIAQLKADISIEGHSKRLLLSVSDGIEIVHENEILYCKADANYTEIHLKERKMIVVSKNLAQIEKLLDQQFFFRIHHSYLVNLTAIKRFRQTDGSEIILFNQTSLPVSRRKKMDLLEAIQNLAD